MLKDYYIGTIKEKQNRRIIMRVHIPLAEGFYSFWIYFWLSRDCEYFKDVFKLKVFKSWYLEFIDRPDNLRRKYKLETETIRFNLDWKDFQRTDYFYGLIHDLAMLNAYVDFAKFKRLYEHYRLRDKLFNL